MDTNETQVQIGDAKVELEEATVGAEYREELVIGSDVKEVMKMTKDELKSYAFSRFGFKLDLTKKISLLRLQTVTLIKQKLQITDKPKVETKSNNNEPDKNGKRPRLLLHTGNGRVFDWSPLLAKRADMVPCNGEGKKL